MNTSPNLVSGSKARGSNPFVQWVIAIAIFAGGLFIALHNESWGLWAGGLGCALLCVGLIVFSQILGFAGVRLPIGGNVAQAFLAIAIVLGCVSLLALVSGRRGMDVRDTTPTEWAMAISSGCHVYSVNGGAPIAGNPAKPMTVERANQILKQINQPSKMFPQGTTVTRSVPRDAKFPEGWGEVSAGVFEPVP